MPRYSIAAVLAYLLHLYCFSLISLLMKRKNCTEVDVMVGGFDLIIKFMLFSKFPLFLVIITPVLAPPPALSETNPAPVLHRYRFTKHFFSSQKFVN